MSKSEISGMYQILQRVDTKPTSQHYYYSNQSHSGLDSSQKSHHNSNAKIITYIQDQDFVSSHKNEQEDYYGLTESKKYNDIE